MLNSSCRPKRGQANRRERVRTENVNAGFDKLRKLIPTEPEDRKLSKIEILRLATSYIRHLYNLTRASSCLEADELDKRQESASEEENEDATIVYMSPAIADSQQATSKRQSRKHVCTFCLMMTKHQPAAMRAQKSGVAGKLVSIKSRCGTPPTDLHVCS